MNQTSKIVNTTILHCFYKAGLILTGVFALAFYFKGTPGYFIFLFAGGWLTWTFVEYGIHRFLMHELIIPEKTDSIFHHHEHHHNPGALQVSLIHRAIVLFLGIIILWVALKLNSTFSIFAGFFMGFLMYNLLHYLLHQPICKYILPRIQRAHILHHTRCPNQGYSFSTILWDWLFGTLAPKNVEITEKMKKFYFESSKNSFKKMSHQNPVKMKNQLKSQVLVLLPWVVSLSVFSCAPVFSDLQSARTVGKGQVEATPFFTTNNAQNELGANIAVGVSDLVDIRARYEYVSLGDSEGVSVFGIGPKFGIIPERIATFLPIGSTFGETSKDSWIFQPTMLFTQPLKEDKVELTLSPKYLFYLCESCGGDFATNLGLAFSKDLNVWAARIEYGRLFGDGGIGQFSLGFSFNVNPKD